MPPKKASAPPPASDESDSDFDDRPGKRPSKKPTKVVRDESEPARNPDEQLEAAVQAMFEGKNGESDGEDDGADLFALKLPPRPNFLTKPDRSNRLMILNVEVENFKSYYGKASIGPFHKSFTSIIGPNGSGKSNLIDSLLFVFGFRASKIRSAKVGNLVHSSKGKDPKFCTVTIHFQRIVDQHQSYTVVENSKFTISRTAFRNNSSSYAIDGRPATKQDVEKCLRKVDIDIEHNRFLILQGEVEQISMMKPVKITKNETGMVEYLEDIIGSNRLEPFVRRFQRRCNRLLIQQSQQRIAREHARGSKVAMEGNVRVAIEFLSKENETKTMKMKLDQRRRLRYMDKAAPLTEALDAARAEKKEIAEKLDANKSEDQASEEQEKKLTKERASLDKKIDKLAKELNDVATEETRRKETMKRYQGEVEKAQTEMEKETKKRATLEALPAKAEKKIEKLKEEVETLAEIEKTGNEQARKNLTNFEAEAEEPKEEQRKLQEIWATVNVDFNKIRSEATVASEELEDMKKQANSGTKKLDDLKMRYANYEEKYEREKAELDGLRPELERIQDKLQRVGTELPGLRTEARNKQHEFAKARESLAELRQQNMSSASTSRLMKVLTQARDEGIIPSFKGRLGDLGYIDKKYDAAISTNFAGRLKYLIVGKAEDATKVLNLLHKHNLAREHVFPLDRFHFDARLLAPAPPGKYPAPRLMDLIECDDEYRPAFYDALRNTIVANTSEEATKFCKMPQCRQIAVATLQGNQFEGSGRATGGGNPRYGGIVTDRSKKAKTVTKEDKQAESHLAEKVEQLRREAEELKKKEQKIDFDLMESRRLHAELSHKESNLTNSVQSDHSAMETLRKTIESLEKETKRVKVDKKELDEKQRTVDELFKKRDELGEQASKAKARQEKVKEKLDELFRDLVQRHRDEASDAQEKRLKAEKDMAKEAANITNNARNIAKCEETITRLQKDIDKKRKLLDDLEERAPDEETQEAKKTAVEEMETTRKQLETEYVELTKKRSGLSKAETELEEALVKKNEEVMGLKERMGAHREKIKEIEKSLSSMKLNRIPRFHFLVNSTRPEDLEMQFEEDNMPVVDENQSPEEVAKQKKHMACVMSDAAYAMEFGMRQKVLDNTESYDNVDGDKLIPVELLSEEKVREISDRDAEELQFKLKQAEQALETLKAKVDLSCIDTYVKKVKQFNDETIKMVAVTAEYRRHNIELHRIKKMRLEEFHNAFEFIGKHLVAVYKMLTDGGDAKLEYIDKDDPFTQGISFMVRPAKKAWKQIQFLSGGEKTLSSLALIFALHMFRPTPFYVMDEIDAALDYRNVSIIAQYVRQKTENAQFIIISLRNNMFELANRLVGIYKVDGCTQNVAIDPLAVCEAAKNLAINLEEYSNTPTMPEEVTRVFQETRNRQNKEMTAQEKQYPNFPSSSEITKAEKIVSVEGRVRKEIDTSMAPSTSRPATRATERAPSTRPESRSHQMRMPVPRLVARPPFIAPTNTTTTSRTPRKERNTEPDDTTPPAKRSNSNHSPRKENKSAQKTKRKSRRADSDDEEDEEEE